MSDNDTTTPENGPDDGLHASSAIPQEEIVRLTDDIISALKTVYDPEIPADIYELGLIYRVEITDDRFVNIDMTLTAPGCPVAGEMPGWVEAAVQGVPFAHTRAGNAGALAMHRRIAADAWKAEMTTPASARIELAR